MVTAAASALGDASAAISRAAQAKYRADTVNFCSHKAWIVYPPLTRLQDRKSIFPRLSNRAPDSTHRTAVDITAEWCSFPFPASSSPACHAGPSARLHEIKHDGLR